MSVLECRGCPLVAIDDMEYVFHLVVDLKYKSQEQQNYKNKKKSWNKIPDHVRIKHCV